MRFHSADYIFLSFHIVLVSLSRNNYVLKYVIARYYYLVKSSKKMLILGSFSTQKTVQLKTAINIDLQLSVLSLLTPNITLKV